MKYVDKSSDEKQQAGGGGRGWGREGIEKLLWVAELSGYKRELWQVRNYF